MAQGSGLALCESVSAIRQAVGNYRRRGEQVGFVPTMGSLHEGHLSLVRLAKANANRVVVSIFVNPTQFESPDDLDKYPSDIARDLDLLASLDVDAVFLPDIGTMYPDGAETFVETVRLANIWHGLVRPGHFRGVSTVVCKLFNIVAPDIAVFGEKDYQQLHVIRRMVDDLFMPIDIIAGSTVREADGLAMSSRNQRLSAKDRQGASVLYQSLKMANAMVAAGTTVDALRQTVTDAIAAEPRAKLEMLDICAAHDLSEVSGAVEMPLALMVYAQFGEVLLIDQIVVSPLRASSV